MTLANLRTIYNRPVRADLGARRADELQLGDLITGRRHGAIVNGVVERITPITFAAPAVRLRLVDDLDGSHRGESTYPADQQFQARRSNTTNNAGRTP